MGEKINKEMLIELVRNEPGLWNKREKMYNNRDLKPDLWDKIGKSLNTTGKVAQKSWETLRDSYRKIRKRAQSDTTVKKDISWPHYEAMCFLDDLLTPRDAYPGLPSPKREPIEEKYDYVEKHCVVEQDDGYYAGESHGELRLENEKKARNRGKRKLEEETPDRRKLQLLDSRQFQKMLYETDDDYLFLMSLLPYLKKLDDVQKMRLRIEILRSVTEELENSKYQEVSASSWHPTAFATVAQGPSASNSTTSSRPPTPISLPGNAPDGHDHQKRQRHGYVNVNISGT